MTVSAGGGGAREEGSSKPKGKPKGTTAAVVSADAAAAAAAAATGKEGEKQEEGMFSFKGQVIAAIVVTAVAGNILGARRFRKTMVDQVTRNAQRKAETERMAKAARDRARQARGTEGAGGGGWGAGGGSGGANASFGGNPLGGGAPDGWEFDDSREPAFREQRLNSQVVQHLSTLGVTNFLAGRAEVQAAYRGRAMHLHPDRNTDDADSVAGGGGDSKNANEQEFKRVSAAYAWLDHNYFLRRRPPS